MKAAASAAVPYWRLSGFYFFFFAILGSLLPYWPLYLSSLGLAPLAIGLVMAVLAGTKIIAPNLWGWIADRSGRPMGVVRFATFWTLASFAAVVWRSDLAWLVAVTFVYSFFWNAALPIFEAVTLHHLRDQAFRYSRVRLWGSIGFIAAVLAVGWALDSYPVAWLPALIAALMAALWLAGLAVPAGVPPPHQQDSEGYGRLLLKGEVLAFLTANLLLQLAHGPYYTFFTVYLKDHGYSSSLAGQFWSLGVAAEVALFYGMTWLQRHFSLRQWLLLGLAAGVLRWWAIAVAVDRPFWLAAAQLLHAFTFGSAHVAGIHLVHRYFGGRHHSKGQALYNSVGHGVGGMLGSYLSGALWTDWGGALVFQGAALVSLLAFAIAWFGVRVEPPMTAGHRSA